MHCTPRTTRTSDKRRRLATGCSVCVLCAVRVGCGGRRGSPLVKGVATEARREAMPEPKGRGATETAKKKMVTLGISEVLAQAPFDEMGAVERRMQQERCSGKSGRGNGPGHG